MKLRLKIARSFGLGLGIAIGAISVGDVSAELRPEKVRVADTKKNLSYLRDGMVVGGDRAIDSVVVRDIRYANNAGFERIVVDLQGTRNGEPAAISRAPYFQVAVSPEEKRLVVTIRGKNRLEFDAKRVQNAFAKSLAISGIELLPKIEDDAWTFVFNLRGEHPVEVFELANPVRLIIDIKNKPSAKAPKGQG